MNPDLDSDPLIITVSQGWEVVKLVYSAPDSLFSPAFKLNIFKDQQSFDGGIKSILTKNTCDTIVGDAAFLESVFASFEDMALSLTDKASFAEGWNNLVHLDTLQNVYKGRYFADLPILRKTLVSNHFEFFYQNLKPIDDDLEATIAEFNQIDFPESDMIGHMKALLQIKYMYELRLKLYNFNN